MNIAGVDECGRGPLAGPVVAAAVVLPQDCPIDGLTDSKKLSSAKREYFEPIIKANALSWSIASVDVEIIDQINIFAASLKAMKLALKKLSIKVDQALIDGKFIPEGLTIPAQAIIKGDASVASISAASILAKQYRDRLMIAYEQDYPGYGFDAHKGYPTKRHVQALGELGVTPIHRRSFAPVAKLLAGQVR